MIFFDDRARKHGLMSVAVALAAAAWLGGCAGYSPSNLSAMSAEDICELEYRQGRNISAEGKRAIQSELQRRNDNCGNHAAEVAARYDLFMYRETYGRPDTN